MVDTFGKCCVVAIFAFMAGFLVGGVMSAKQASMRLEGAGIKDIAFHYTQVDGVVTTNWYEIVWAESVEAKRQTPGAVR